MRFEQLALARNNLEPKRRRRQEEVLLSETKADLLKQRGQPGFHSFERLSDKVGLGPCRLKNSNCVAR